VRIFELLEAYSGWPRTALFGLVLKNRSPPLSYSLNEQGW